MTSLQSTKTANARIGQRHGMKNQTSPGRRLQIRFRFLNFGIVLDRLLHERVERAPIRDCDAQNRKYHQQPFHR